MSSKLVKQLNKTAGVQTRITNRHYNTGEVYFNGQSFEAVVNKILADGAFEKQLDMAIVNENGAQWAYFYFGQQSFSINSNSELFID